MRLGPALPSVNGMVSHRGLGDWVTTTVPGMQGSAVVEDTASFIGERIAGMMNTVWGWVTPDQAAAEIQSLVADRCGLYPDSCAGIDSGWIAQAVQSYTQWYTQAMQAYMAQHNGMTPDQAQALGQQATDTYNQTLLQAQQNGMSQYDAQTVAQNAAAQVASGMNPAPSAAPGTTALVPPQQTRTVTGGTTVNQVTQGSPVLGAPAGSVVTGSGADAGSGSGGIESYLPWAAIGVAAFLLTRRGQ